LKNLFKKLINGGNKSELSTQEQKQVIITNFVLLLASLVALLRCLIYGINGDPQYSFISLTASVTFFILYFLNTRGFYDLAKYSLMIVGSIATGFKEIQAGGTGGQLFLILASFGVAFLLFGIKHKTKLIFALIIPFVNLLLAIIIPVYQNHGEFNFADNKEILIGVLSNVLISVSIIWYFVKKSSDIEDKLIDTNTALSNSNEAIEERNAELKTLYFDLIKQKEIIEIKNEEIYASIRYAKRIQSAFLPNYLNKLKSVEESFLLFQPKDIVSGDFYWWTETSEFDFICVADCTGHGVPGAMLSLLGMIALNDAVKTLGIKDLDLILEFVDNYIIEHIKKENDKFRDGIELSIIKINKSTKKIYYSGAKRPIIVIQNSELKVYKPSRRFVGEQNPGIKEFQNIEIDEGEGAQIYMFTDGYLDQANKKRKKIGIKKFKELALEYHSENHETQKEKFETYLKNHLEDEEIRDDIVVLGIKV
jgi:serine phosphatase RsbU (regulator of sigma subunit)